MNGSAFPQNDKKQLSRLVDSRYQSNDPNVSGEPVLNAPQPPVTEPSAMSSSGNTSSAGSTKAQSV